MKKTYIIGIIILMIIAIIFLVLLYNKDNNNNSNNTKVEAMLFNVPNSNNIIVDKYANLTVEQRDELGAKRSVEKVSLQIQDGTLTKEGATIVITDRNEYTYSYGEDYTIKKLENGEWSSLKQIKGYNINDIAHLTDENGQVVMEFNWKDRYGELENGKYRLLMEINSGDPDTTIYTDFEIK